MVAEAPSATVPPHLQTLPPPRPEKLAGRLGIESLPEVFSDVEFPLA